MPLPPSAFFNRTAAAALEAMKASPTFPHSPFFPVSAASPSFNDY
jgi:hypothetical protein